jgi:heat shock protein HslJ
MKRLGVGLGLLLALTACARPGTPAPGASVPGGGPWGHTFVSTSSSRDLVAGTRIELRFGDAKLDAQAGCNHLIGTARIEQGRLAVDDLGATAMGCDPPRQAQDSWLTTFLGARPTVLLSGPDLVLEGSGVRIDFVRREVADPDKPLTGPEWTVDTLISGQAASSVPAGVRPFLTFAPDGTVSGSGGCNQLAGRYTVQPGAITFIDLVSTKKACVDDRGTVETRVVGVVKGTVQYKIEAGHLTLTAPDGNGLRLAAAASPSPS